MSVGVVVALAVGGTVLLGAGLTWMVLHFNRQFHAEEAGVLGRLREASPRQGWMFAERDDSVAELYTWQQQECWQRNPFRPLLRPPRASRAKNVITGFRRGRPFVAAQLDVHYDGEFQRVQWIAVTTPAARPTLSVTRSGPIASTVNNALWGEVRVGYPEFDARFDVMSPDPRFAMAALSPALAEFLLRDPRILRGFTLLADRIDVFDATTDHREPGQLVAALDLRCEILDRIPAAAWA